MADESLHEFLLSPGMRGALLDRGNQRREFLFYLGGNCVKSLSCFCYITILEPVNSGYFISREPLMQPYSHNHEYLWFISATTRGSDRIFAGDSGNPNCIVKSRGKPVHITGSLIWPEEIASPLFPVRKVVWSSIQMSSRIWVLRKV